MASVSTDAKLVVKHTFLEFVDSDLKTETSRNRAFTESMVFSDCDPASSSRATSLPPSPALSDVQEDLQTVQVVECEEHQAEDGIFASAGIDVMAFDGRSPESSPWVGPMGGPVDSLELESWNAEQQFQTLPPMMMQSWNSDCNWWWMPPATGDQFMVDEISAAWMDPSMDMTTMVSMEPFEESSESMHFEKLLDKAFGGVVSSVESEATEIQRTTVMIRNLPAGFSRDDLVELIDSEGFKFRYDFLYLPIDFSSGTSLGYAFVNLILPSGASEFCECFDGYKVDEAVDEGFTVTWSDPHQGLEQHVERYRSSPVMHASVPDDWKPIILVSGVRVPFPQPTKRIKAPKIRERANGKSDRQ